MAEADQKPTRDDDDLSAVLHALASSPRVVLRGGCLSLSAGSGEDSAAPAPALAPALSPALVCAGCKRLVELVHGSAERKSASVSRGVLPALARNRQSDPVFFFAGGPGQPG
jgi:hypothetical protein